MDGYSPAKKNKDKKIIIIAAYIAFCIMVIFFLTLYLNRAMHKENEEQINRILNLMSEKTDNSLDMMIYYIVETANIISAKENFDYEETYKELVSATGDMPYYSIGLIDINGDVYGTKAEKEDINKQDFFKIVSVSDDTYMTEPYRSAGTGTNMVTLFSPFYRSGEKMGSIFMTYYLENIQNLANTEAFSDSATIFMINPISYNYVNCSKNGDKSPGSWSNLSLIRKQIKDINGYSFSRWLENMVASGQENVVNYEYNGVRYAMAYINIKEMKNWSIAIRMPINILSRSMKTFEFTVLLGALILLLATVLLAIILHIGELNENKRLKTVSELDPLTGIYNRRAFYEKLGEIFTQFRNKPECSFMFFDIDYFKQINDSHGHDDGDFVLNTVATMLTRAFKDNGLVARVGGDEFNVFIYKKLSKVEINSILNGIKKDLNDIVLKDGTEYPITFSAGLASYPEDSENIDDLIQYADDALYHTKEHGRNGYTWYASVKENNE